MLAAGTRVLGMTVASFLCAFFTGGVAYAAMAVDEPEPQAIQIVQASDMLSDAYDNVANLMDICE